MLNKLYNLKLKQKSIIISSIFTIILLSSFGYFGIFKIQEVNSDLAITKNKVIVSDVSNEINTFLQTIPNDLHFLTNYYSLQSYLQWKKIGENKISKKSLKLTKNVFTLFKESKDYIYEIQYVNKNGLEEISLFDNTNIKSLNDISKSDIFNKTMKLSLNETYVSDIYLAKKNGEIISPSIPLIKFSEPILNSNNIKQGIIIITLRANKFLKSLQKYEKKLEIIKGDVLLVNNNGKYIYNNTNVLSNTITLKNDNLTLYNEILKKDFGGVLLNNGIYSYKKIYFALNDKTRFWVLITKADKELSLKESNDLLNIYIVLIVLMIIFTLYFINKLISKIIDPVSEVSKLLNILSLGNIPKKAIEYKYNDEIGVMAKSLNELTKAISVTSNQVKSIANGEYSNEIKLLSSSDELGISINHMSKELQKNEIIFNKAKWLNNGYSKLSDMLSAEMDLNDLGNKSISFLSRYIKANDGSFYSFNKDTNTIQLIGSFVNSKNKTINSNYDIKSGVIAQVYNDKEAILINDIDNKSSTSLTQFDLKSSYTFPIIFDDEIEGIIEIVSKDSINDDDIEFFHKVEDLISNVLHSVNQRIIINKLLDDANIDKVNIEKQSINLQKVNEQMQEQQQQLEETNAQMEEQQHQLKMNSKILEDKNKVLLDSQDSLHKKTKDLEQSNKYKGEFLANMSHELRTPLNSIILLSNMLSENKKSNLNQKDVKKAQVIYSSGNELLRLINDILDLSKVEAGKMDLIIDEFESCDFIENIKNQFEFSVEDKNLEFIVKDNYKSKISNDKNRLGQVIKNLLSNALKFTKTGSITLTIDKVNDENVKLSIIDTGVGIDNKKLDLIFGAFQQADGGTSREYGGTGLGLSISKELSNLMQGSIDVKSNVNEGSVFSITIPNLKTIDKTVSTSKTITKQVIDDINKISKDDKVYLIIEDDEIFAEILREQINDNGEYAIISLTGKEGLNLALEYNIKGVILDLGLPDIDGVDLLKEFKLNEELSSIPIHVVSGEDRDIMQSKYSSIGFTQKPMSKKQIELIFEDLNHLDKGNQKTVLIVEDNKIQRDAISEYIKNNNLKVVDVSNIKDAIKNINNTKFDSIVLDLKLEDGSGYEICKYIKEENIDVPVIIYTGKDLSKEEEKKLSEYSDSIIIKTIYSEKRLKNELNVFVHHTKEQYAKKKKENTIINTVLNNTNSSKKIDFKNKKILIVDDDIRNIYVLSELLDSHGAKVISACDGKEALNILEKNLDTKIILMDIMMPIMDGYESTKEIKKNKKTKAIPVVAITAKVMDDDKQKALDAGCIDYTTKPINTEVLLKIIEQRII